ncbi:hypothetical protein BN874_1370018 [Candidatus Contendobacter odensis Run_B_J11]|uniref:DUF2335 domain-containing protein n=2 Tax=Candidatus Contendibacter odensensis TaxID=1400860 RepID=A0A7U7G8K4_9GAMM|nr:hypothetical protein BN874_1370018 [Candidatus Contendobacter odensis Run_B_J11]
MFGNATNFHPGEAIRLTGKDENPLVSADTDEIDADALPPATERAITRKFNTLIAHQSFSGPTPPPDCLRQYDEIVPGAAKDIIEEFKANGAHQRAMDKALLNAASGRDRRTQWMAFSLVILGFILIMALAHTSHDWVAAVVAGSLLGAVVTGFLQGKKSTKDRPTQEDEASDD